MASFKEIAKNVSGGCELMQNRTKLGTRELVAKFPEGVTINGFDFLDGDNGKFPVCTISEDNSIYFFGGKILNNICTEWVNTFGDVKTTNEMLKNEGGVKVKMNYTKTKKGQDCCAVEVL